MNLKIKEELITYIIFSIFICYSVCEIIHISKIKLLFYSEITLTITGRNTQKIINNNTYYYYDRILGYPYYTQFDTKPSEILVNGQKIDKNDFYVENLTLYKNNITIRFNKKLTKCQHMFYQLSNIIYY